MSTALVQNPEPIDSKPNNTLTTADLTSPYPTKPTTVCLDQQTPSDGRSSNGSSSSSGLATMSSSSMDNLPCSTASLASSNCSSTVAAAQSTASPLDPVIPSKSAPALTEDQTPKFQTQKSEPSTATSQPNMSKPKRSVSKRLASSFSSLGNSSSVSSDPTSSSPAVPVKASGDSRFKYRSTCSKIICTPLRTIVSQNRRRYQRDGFNLDLTYITDRIIAMGYPADTSESLYRNSMKHIVKFLEFYHPDHYKVFNLRGQYVYDTSKFHNRVVSFEMKDHHPPKLELIAPFCREVHGFLQEHPKNVVAVHCKAGKGRTGVMICAYLTYINFYATPRQNMDYYSIVRTHNNKGVTIPSQRRYVYYFHHLRQRDLNYMPLKVELVGIYVEKPPRLGSLFSKGALKLRVSNGDVEIFEGRDLWISEEAYEEEDRMYRKYPVTTGDDHYNPHDPTSNRNCVSRRCYGWTVPANRRVFLEGDVRVDLYERSQIKVLNVPRERKKIGHVWFNTMFTCPAFSGGQYIHGDEQYPMDEKSMIVKRKHQKLTNKPSKNAEDTLDDDFEVRTPPGLQHHCPAETLKTLHPNDKHPPRHEIDKMLKNACRRNLVTDLYNNTRRLSITNLGEPMPKSEVGRPDASGPYCLVRKADEHVQNYAKLEVDRAHKSKELDEGLKIIVVTRCIDARGAQDVQLAYDFVEKTRMRQLERDRVKREKLLQKFEKKLSVAQHEGGNTKKTVQALLSSSTDESSVGSNGITDSTAASSSATCSTDDAEYTIPEYENPLEDARKHDPHLSKYFFRQRLTSKSRHPSLHYHCPLFASDPSICAQYGCRHPDQIKRSIQNDSTIPEADTTAIRKDSEETPPSLPHFPIDKRDFARKIAYVQPIQRPSSKIETNSLDYEDRTSTDASSWTTSTMSSQASSDLDSDSESTSSLSAAMELQDRSDTMTVPAYAQCDRGNQVVVLGLREDSRISEKSSVSS